MTRIHFTEMLFTDEELLVLWKAVSEKKGLLETIIGCVSDQKLRSQYQHMLDLCSSLQRELGKPIGKA